MSGCAPICGWIVLFSLLLLSKCLILAFGNISIQNHDSSIYKKSNCGKTLNLNYSIKSDKSPSHCHSVCLFFTLFTFLCNLFYFTSSCIPCLKALLVLLLFVLFLIHLVPRRLMIVSFFFLHLNILQVCNFILGL